MTKESYHKRMVDLRDPHVVGDSTTVIPINRKERVTTPLALEDPFMPPPPESIPAVNQERGGASVSVVEEPTPYDNAASTVIIDRRPQESRRVGQEDIFSHFEPRHFRTVSDLIIQLQNLPEDGILSRKQVA
ncbi:MAG TPA: hypothetical protein VJB65_05245, partial [Patescibacteria group bacterium]|nr:hypothetical protein [Patescibacteria group bacterium]